MSQLANIKNSITVLDVSNYTGLSNLYCDKDTEITRNYVPETFLWTRIYSRVKIVNGKADFSNAAYSHVHLSVKGNQILTEKLAKLSGQLTLLVGNYSFYSVFKKYE